MEQVVGGFLLQRREKGEAATSSESAIVQSMSFSVIVVI